MVNKYLFPHDAAALCARQQGTERSVLTLAVQAQGSTIFQFYFGGIWHLVA